MSELTPTPFTVVGDFQVNGINYEPGNTHRKHNFSDEQVQEFYDVGWVSINGNVTDKPTDLSHVEIEPNDTYSNTEAG